MKKAILFIAGLAIGWAICWFLCCPHCNDDYTSNWNSDKYNHYSCDSFFNKFKAEVSNSSGTFAGVKIQKSDLDALIDTISSTSNVYIALALDFDHNKILLAAGEPNGTGPWNTTQGSGVDTSSTNRPGTDPPSKDTIWFISPGESKSKSKMGYIINRNNKLISYDAATKSKSNIFMNKILKTVLPGRDVTAQPNVSAQGCPKKCPTVIATQLIPIPQ